MNPISREEFDALVEQVRQLSPPTAESPVVSSTEQSLVDPLAKEIMLVILAQMQPRNKAPLKSRIESFVVFSHDLADMLRAETAKRK